MTTKVAVGRDFIQRLIDGNVIPPQCSRFILDIDASGVATIYTRTFPTQEACEVVIDALLAVTKGATIEDAASAAAMIALEENRRLREACKDNAIDIKSYGVCL